MPDIPQQPAPIVIKSAAINEILRTFNILTLPVQPPQQNQFNGKVQAFKPDNPLYTSPLGTPVMQDITFKSVQYTDKDTGKERVTKEVTLINFLLTVSQQKRIITTEIPGRNGTVKEYIGMDDSEITINGLIVGANGQFPIDEFTDLKNMLTATSNPPVSFEVVCSYLNNLDIHNLVIKDFTFDQEAGGFSKVPFTINALSDHAVLLQVF